MARPKKVVAKTTSSYLSRIENDVKSNQSKLNMFLGALIILVVGILIFNYFNRNKPDLGPAQTTTQEEHQDVSVENLPGKYTVKEGDTLFTIADKYYKDGYQYTEIAKANNLADPNNVAAGQVLEIPKLENTQTPTPSESPAVSPTPQETVASESTIPVPTTEWGPKITENTYTVVDGDWLSTIAARAYNGDIPAYKKLAEANNISNPDYIVPGQVLTIPR